MGKRKAGENSEEPQAKVSKAAKAKAGAAKAEPRAKAEPKAKVEPAPKAEPKAEPKRLSRSKSKVSSSIAPLLDAENDAAALASSTGAKYNVELMQSCQDSLQSLVESTWQKSINDLGERYYSTPSRFHDRVRVAIAPDWHVSCDAKKVKPVSPLENVMAFVLSMYRDNEDEELMVQWKRFALTVTFEYVVATSDADIYFLSANQRQDIMSDKETMCHTALQKIFSVLACKARMEKISGPQSNLA
ncbi:unnamed protein product [Cladocopium goreaui]|uniref:Modification methylase SinI n=1 Tax=Cladocopium goreaui TaxID=2562237 RepID=A0A9P1CHN8_9DINO|nr:unnamed protein product [Cladocopium goreaui]CAI4009365.1 unnamed protein product [Cladocopium goreaui]